MEALSESDPLTGLPNRRHLAHLLPEVLEEHAPVCVGVIDLDGFKRVNDEFGYLEGDSVLQEVAGVLERVCRRGGSVIRLGGDEFLMVLRETSPGDARSVFSRDAAVDRHSNGGHGIPGSVVITAFIGRCGSRQWSRRVEQRARRRRRRAAAGQEVETTGVTFR